MKKVREYLSKWTKKPLFWFSLVFVLVDIMLTRQILIKNHLGTFLVVAVELIFEAAMIALLILAEKKKWKLEKKFLIMAIGLGAMFIMLLPPGQSPDEISHFRRAYGISEGVLIADEPVNSQGSVGSEIPVEIYMLEPKNVEPAPGIYKQTAEWLVQKPSGETSKQPYANTALYNFLCYLPQALGALVGKVFNFSVVGITYLMKIFNFVVWIVLTYFAIKIIPKFKSIAAFIALLPITLQEATSCSPDALAIGLSMLLVAFVLYLSYAKKGRMSKWEHLLLYVIAVMIGLCKIVYFPLVLLYLTIPKERFGTNKKRWLHLGAIAAVTLVVNLSWLAVSSSFLIEFMPGVNSKAQVSGILTNPIGYVTTMFRTVTEAGFSWMQLMLGMSLGSFKFNMPVAMILVAYGFAVLLFAQRDETLKISKFNRGVFAAVFAIVVALVLTSLYVQWTAVGAELIDGVQGRYFLPILLLVPVIIARGGTRKKDALPVISQNTVLYYSLFMNVIAFVLLFAQNF